MIRFTKALAAAAALLLAPSLASAAVLEIVNVTGAGAGGVLLQGETVTFDLRINYEGATGADIRGVSADVTGYDLPGANFDRELGLALAGGQVTDQILGADFGSGPQFGLTNDVNPSGTPTEIFEINNLNPLAYTTNLFGGVSTGPLAGDGSDDLGIGGGLVSGGDVHFQVTLQNVFGVGSSATVADISFDLTVIDAFANETTTSTTFALQVVPEPGTALLMGLGLAGLASTRRR